MHLPAPLRARLIAHARAEVPCECVGLLGGHDRPGVGSDVRAMYPLRNAAPDPQRTYIADPGHVLRALKAMRAEGLDLVGIYHSHPRGPAVPSRTDVQLAAYGVPYLIVDVQREDVRAYRLPELTEEPLLS
ncbi:Mov34/MPN/PAD-1 family protein [Deinococcus maricopensis]|uniref:Mov34/MPN/PAD-1 family protein n=1 Tax=Deinococcus maricopensis (strain DSM 21211 / LMG 22137 / NRRL B-23946 / LB-34) TaxID=709986 RepID=E8U7J5_DEIML|nr:M67 family metallopeptidase [Deinococcus maricopensis]ADV67034.1 Mov34/MPN/PAD-1 family protein [Deinococcus maricopensis DSM 21211]